MPTFIRLADGAFSLAEDPFTNVGDGGERVLHRLGALAGPPNERWHKPPP